jgi:peptidylprolyl isomerase
MSVAAVALLAAGCSQGTANTAVTASPLPTIAPLPVPTPTIPVLAPVSCDIGVTTDTAHKPTITFAKACPAATALQGKDIVAGTGPVLEFGQTAVVQYVGIALSNRKQFDASWDRHQPSTVPNIGQSSAIEGWNQGLLGMHKGGRRLLVIPPDLGYGNSGSAPVKPNETLVFVVDLVNIQS